MENKIDAARLFKIIALKEYEIDILREKLSQAEQEKEGKNAKPLDKTEA